MKNPKTAKDAFPHRIFAENLKVALNNQGKKQKDIIHDLGYSQATVSAWCTGARMPRHNTIAVLAEYLDTTVSALMIEPEDRDLFMRMSQLSHQSAIDTLTGNSPDTHTIFDKNEEPFTYNVLQFGLDHKLHKPSIIKKLTNISDDERAIELADFVHRNPQYFDIIDNLRSLSGNEIDVLKKLFDRIHINGDTDN